VQRRTEAVMKHPVSNRRSDQTTGSQTAGTKCHGPISTDVASWLELGLALELS